MLRVLFVLPDTDDSEDNHRVMQLHRTLGDAGVEVRTVALAPGRTGGLDAVLPVLSHAARSPAAVTQLRREQRWADVIGCSGAATAWVQRFGGSRRRTAVIVMPRLDSRARLSQGFASRGATVVHDWLDERGWHRTLVVVAGGLAEPPDGS